MFNRGFKKSKLTKIVLLIVSSLTVVICVLFFQLRSSIVLDYNFANKVYSGIIEHSMVDFNYLADFEWEWLLIASPYTRVSDMLRSEGIRWRGRDTQIEFHDGIALFLFIHNNRVVAHMNYPLYRGDFLCSFTDILAWYVWDREYAKFIIGNCNMCKICIIPIK